MNYTFSLRRLCLVALIGSVVSCVNTKTIDREVNAWMACLDCGPHADERLQFLGERALPALIKIIVSRTSDADIIQAKSRLRDRYRILVSYASQSKSKLALAWENEDQYVDYYLGSIDTRRLRAAYAILLICQPPNRCDQIRPFVNGFPAFAKELVKKENQELFLRIVAQYPR